MLKISKVETFYGKILALRGFDIDVNDGEIASLIGSNGAGKTTLLITINGVNKARNGKITFKGENIENISNSKRFEISKKYQFLDDIFLKVLNNHPTKMSDIFFNMFKTSPKTVIKFLSNKSNFFEDLKIILKMPKWTFIKALFY